jgi:hypothetical protein
MDTRADTPADSLDHLPEPAAAPLRRDESADLATDTLEPTTPPEAGWGADDALAEFPTESEAEAARSAKASLSGPPGYPRATVAWPIVAAFVLLALIAVGAWRWWPANGTAPAETGTVAIESAPAGAAVVIDGRERGKTPLTLPLSAGTHTVVLNGSAARRELSVTVVPGTQVVHHVELTAAAAPGTGRLQVSGPVGAPIVVDGVRRGVTPAELAELAPGEHSVIVGEGAAAVTQRVTVPAGGVASLFVPVSQPGARAAPAWISIASPIELQVFDGEALIGSSTTERILVLAGQHELNLVNADLGYKAARSVAVQPGRVATVRVDVPNGVLHVNATPWAEVLVDGKRVGETPLANVAVPIGAHELTLRNPKFPEQKRSVVISLGGATRVGVDLRQ